MSGLADLIGYIILIIILIVALLTETRHYVCDSYGCDVLIWSKERSNNDREKYVNLIDYMTRPSAWMKAYIAALIITAVACWWFLGTLPHILGFLAPFLFVFFVIYFLLTFYQHHYLAPLGADLKGYLQAACSQWDPRTRGDEEVFEQTAGVPGLEGPVSEWTYEFEAE